MTALRIILPIAFALVGVLVGCVYFYLMRYSLTKFSAKRHGMWQLLGLALLRFVLFGGGLLAAALIGAWCWITYAVGFIVARFVTLTRSRTWEVPSAAPSENQEDDR